MFIAKFNFSASHSSMCQYCVSPLIKDWNTWRISDAVLFHSCYRIFFSYQVSKQSVYKMMSRAIHRSWSFGRLCQQTQSRLMSNGEFHCRSGMFSERRIKSNFTKISHIPTLRVVRHHFQCPIKTGVLSIRSHQRECNIRCFHKSSRNQAQPFLLLMLFKSAAKMSAILSGRYTIPFL